MLAGKLRTLAVMSDQRFPGAFVNVPTLKERKIDLSVGAWRGLAVPKGTPADIVETLRVLARKAAAEPLFKEVLEKSNLGYFYAEADVFKAAIVADRDNFKGVLSQINLQR